jgi:hypothetical protein
MSSTKILVAAVGAVACAPVITALSAAPAYADGGYYMRPCAAPAVSGAGTQNNGCGNPYWVPSPTADADQIIDRSLESIGPNYQGMHQYYNDGPITRTLNEWADHCGAKATLAVILSIGTDTEEVVAPRVFIGCARSKAEAAVLRWAGLK